MRPGKDHVGVGVGAMIFKRGTLLLMRRGQAVRNERGCWDIPGGGVEVGERRADAVVREVLEEVGLDVRVRHELHATDHLIPEEDEHWVTTSFICRSAKGQNPEIREPHKCDEIGWFPLDALPSPLTITMGLTLEAYRRYRPKRWYESRPLLSRLTRWVHR